MKILRRILIALLLIANAALLVYVLNGIKEPPQEILAENVTTVSAPDQTEAQIHPDFIKEEFVMVLPEGVNIAAKKPIKANAFTDVYAENRANDGSTDGSSYWEGTSEYPNLLTVDLENPAKIQTVRVALNPLSIWGKRTQTIAVNISSDGENFTELVKMKQYTFDPDEGNQIQIPFDEVETRYVQLVFTENSGAVGGQVAEFEVYSK
ncbi:MAG: coagulation factor 5/8 type domain protein [Herbinix sp.]|jgi:hypothetical protein|nr:coagulation factor 5/8 type domain protein [Herbinix sp.]